MGDPDRFRPKPTPFPGADNFGKSVLADEWEDDDMPVNGADDPLALNESKAHRIAYLRGEADKFDDPDITTQFREQDYVRHQALKRARSQFFVRQAEEEAAAKRARRAAKHK